MQIPRSYVVNYSRALNVVSERARAALVDALSQLDYTADIADIRNAVIAIMQPACGASATMAARLAADFYDGLRAQFGIDDGYMAQVDSQRVPEATTGAVKAFVQDLVDDKPIEQFVGKCADRIDYETRKAANECVEFNAKNDPKKPRWARVPTGAETCQFCIMLASRGFVYHSEETASHAHAHCDCRVIPSWDKSPIAQGYDPDKYYDMWKHPEKYVLENSSENRDLQGKLFGQQRGQIDAGQGEVKSNDLASFNDKALQSIIDETGYDKQAAKKFQSSLQEWLGGDYEAFTRGEMQDHVAVIDAGLSRMGAYDSEMYRGMHFSNGSKIDMASFESFKTVQVGSEIEMKSVSSWTSEKAIAERYANIGSDGSSAVVLKCVSNKTAVGVQHISKWRTTEAEVLAPSGAKWRVVDVREVNMYDHTRNQLENGELSPLMKKIKTRELAEKENELRGKTYVVIEVEEIG